MVAPMAEERARMSVTPRSTGTEKEVPVRANDPMTVGTVRSHVGNNTLVRDHPNHAQNKFVPRPPSDGP